MPDEGGVLVVLHLLQHPQQDGWIETLHLYTIMYKKVKKNKCITNSNDIVVCTCFTTVPLCAGCLEPAYFRCTPTLIVHSASKSQTSAGSGTLLASSSTALVLLASSPPPAAVAAQHVAPM